MTTTRCALSLVVLAALAPSSAARRQVDPEGVAFLPRLTQSQTGAQVGRVVALKPGGRLLAASAPNIGTSPVGRGRIWLYRRAAAGFVPHQVLEVPQAYTATAFGFVMTWRGNDLLVSAWAENDAEGAVYVYRFERQRGEFVQKIEVTGLDPDGLFGRSFADGASEHDVWIGAMGDGAEPNSLDRGSLLHFTRVNGVWVETSRWQNQDSTWYRVGGTVTRVGDQLAVDGGFDDVRIMDVLPDGSLVENHRLDPPGVPSGFDLGYWLDAEGDELFVGMPHFRTAPFHRYGRVLVYQRDAAGIFQLRQTLEAPPGTLDSQISDEFGSSFAVEGDRLVVGAPRSRNPALANQGGGVFLFERGPAGWQLTESIYPDDPTNSGYSGYFGCSVDIHGSTIAIGSRAYNELFTGEGATYVTERRLGTTVCASDCGPLASATPGLLRIFGSEFASRRDLLLHASGLPPGATAAYFLASVDRSAPVVTPGLAGCLCLAAPLQRLRLRPVANQGSGQGSGRGAAMQNPFNSVPFELVGPLASTTTYFQAWYRDSSGGPGAGSRLSNTVAIEWR